MTYMCLCYWEHLHCERNNSCPQIHRSKIDSQNGFYIVLGNSQHYLYYLHDRYHSPYSFHFQSMYLFKWKIEMRLFPNSGIRFLLHQGLKYTKHRRAIMSIQIGAAMLSVDLPFFYLWRAEISPLFSRIYWQHSGADLYSGDALCNIIQSQNTHLHVIEAVTQFPMSPNTQDSLCGSLSWRPTDLHIHNSCEWILWSIKNTLHSSKPLMFCTNYLVEL